MSEAIFIDTPLLPNTLRVQCPQGAPLHTKSHKEEHTFGEGQVGLLIFP